MVAGFLGGLTSLHFLVEEVEVVLERLDVDGALGLGKVVPVVEREHYGVVLLSCPSLGALLTGRSFVVTQSPNDLEEVVVANKAFVTNVQDGEQQLVDVGHG